MNSYLAPRNFGCRITEFNFMGYSAVALQNESLRITVLAGKGADLIEFLYKPVDLDFLWLSYPGLRPAGLPTVGVPDASGSFLDTYPGGWQEVLPNFGEPCVHKGASLGLHAEVSLLPWQYTILQDDPTCVSVQFSVRCIRTPFALTRVMTLCPGSVLRLQEKLVNESSETVDCTWGHHPALGGAFLDETCRIHVPPCRVKTPQEYVSPNARLEKAQDSVWPFVRTRGGEMVDLSIVPPPSQKSHDMAYLYDLKAGWYAVTNQSRNVGFGMVWDSRLFKYLWFWQVFRGWSGYPWYGMTYNMALEPCSSYPPSLAQAVQSGTQLRLEPGERVETELSAVVFKGIPKVGHITLDGDVMRTAPT